MEGYISEMGVNLCVVRSASSDSVTVVTVMPDQNRRTVPPDPGIFQHK